MEHGERMACLRVGTDGYGACMRSQARDKVSESVACCGAPMGGLVGTRVQLAVRRLITRHYTWVSTGEEGCLIYLCYMRIHCRPC